MNAGERSIGALPPQEKERLAYLEGKEDLFPTKLFSFGKEGQGERSPGLSRILIVSRDPGSGNALAPVVELLYKEAVEMQAMVDGRAEEIFRGKFNLDNITSSGGALHDLGEMELPDLILTGPSEEPGIETAVASTFPNVPVVLLDVYYGDSLRLFEKFKTRGIPLPAAICVMDQEAKRIIVEYYPELEGCIQVTGLPSFDRFAHEDTDGIARQTREHLHILPEEKIVAFMATIDMTKAMVKATMEQVKQVKTPLAFIFRRHPRDNTSYAEYRAIVEEAGIRWIDTQELNTDAVGAVADLVLTTTSTEGLHAIYRRKPSLHINDTRYKPLYPGIFLPLPQVRTGASAGTENIAEAAGLMEVLLDPQSARNQELRRNMETQYPRDGKNAQRVVDVIKNILPRRSVSKSE